MSLLPELYEISPYAQFAVGFRTFGHVENQDMPSRHNKHGRYDTGIVFTINKFNQTTNAINRPIFSEDGNLWDLV